MQYRCHKTNQQKYQDMHALRKVMYRYADDIVVIACRAPGRIARRTG